MAKALPEEYDREGFEQFWVRYPRRDARIDAYKAWRQLRPSPQTKADIFDALVWQIPLHQWEDRRQFCPLPATYLRNERWTDERRSGQDRRAVPQVGRRALVPDDEPL